MSKEYHILIDGEDRTACIYHKTVVIVDEARDKPSTLKCTFIDNDGLGNPGLEEEIIITLEGTTIFGGYILSADINTLGNGNTIMKLECLDYSRDLDRLLVKESYQDMTDLAIITDIVERYCPDSGITAVNVVEGVTISQITFNYMTPSACLSKICDLTGRSWYIDYAKDIHYFTASAPSAPFNIDDASANYWDLSIRKDNTNIRNRVYVRGGTYLSDEVSISMVADGEQTVFNLPEKPSDITVKEDTVAKTVGIKNIDDPADYDYLVNYQEKYIEATVAPVADVVINVLFKYYIPVLVAVQDEDSIDDVGVFEFPIFDNTIRDVQQARDRAAAEISDYKNTIIDGIFHTTVDGFRAGQYVNINVADLDVNADYYIQKVVAHSLGSGQFIYDIYVGSANKIGIIKFLLKMLEADKNYLDISDDEYVDELFAVDSDNLTVVDSITAADLVEPPFTYGSATYGLAEYA